YIAQVEAMYARGIRTFVEVGPKRAQVGFVANILEDRHHRAFPTNHPKQGGMMSLRMAVGRLLVAGHAPQPEQGLRQSVPEQTVTEPKPTPAPANQVRPGDTAWAVPAQVICSGASVGLPGCEDIFSEDAFETLLAGETLIDSAPEDHLDAMLGQKITRLQKGADGTAEFVEVTERDDVIHLSGRLRTFDLSEDYGMEERLAAGMDKASQLAFAAGLEALRDAHIPLVPRYRTTRSGKKVTIGHALPEPLRDETGVIFASAFTGLDVAIEEATKAASDPDYQFDGRYLLRLIGMGHARFAETLGARGPNTRINAACASTTQGVAMAEDWIKTGRCRRVIVIGADDVTDDTMMPWVGSGFLATGAATAESDVSQAALPFDRRRNGTILGAGAVALVVEHADEAAKRGVIPLADLLATRLANSAYHSTRLDVDHIKSEVNALLAGAESTFEVERQDIARRGVFVSHETFTPPRGGSAAAEVESLRSAFGDDTEQMVMANIKGYTGHPMGAGLEDALAVRMLHGRRVPPIPNLKEPDEDLGKLRFSSVGETHELDYALRLAAGFGSQLALGLWRRRATREDRLDQPTFHRWLTETCGINDPQISIEKRVLRATPGTGKPDTKAVADKKSPAPVEAATAPAPVESAPRPEVKSSPAPAASQWTEGVIGQGSFRARHLEIQ
ncbi:MAG: beta-ketoacyl synthase N-terminal-like domain-containing protein, partial [Myxococcota bacterium]|nr:beta-ketoacyl synthase N-terminal-like domain-containing protein [Myxococcota bacterium]